MATHSLKQISNNTNSKALKIYPEKAKPDGGLHDTIALKLSKEQAIELVTRLLMAAENWDKIHLTAFRQGNKITITSQQPDF
ncbi:hypothetical protein MHI04_22310 [Lysinibacillus sp. FSL K6-1151]|uniref:hypothetical protein n=1 Tax=Lysinibacillus sp. FSL K6-1151 TaxID=2921465 RepID=UPI003159B505